MKRLWIFLSLSALPFTLIRLWDVLKNIDARTGFFHDERWFRHILILLTIAAIVIYEMLSARRLAPAVYRPHNSALVSTFGAVMAMGVLVASILQMIASLKVGGFSYLFATRKNLIHMGVLSANFQAEFWCGLLGLAASSWFGWLAWRYRKDGDLSGRPVFCLLPVVWYCLRTFSDFSYAPVNFHNTLVFSCIVADLLLALGWYQTSYFAAKGYAENGGAKTSVFTLSAFLFTVSFKFPVFFIQYAHHTSVDRVFVLVDMLSAMLLWLITYQYWRGADRHE